MVNSTTTTPASTTCPKCGSELRVRHGSRGKFLGCTGYPNCKFTKSIPATPMLFPTTTGTGPQPTPRLEAPGPTGELVRDLRSAAGHVAAAIDLLRRRGVQIDHLIEDHDGTVTF